MVDTRLEMLAIISWVPFVSRAHSLGFVGVIGVIWVFDVIPKTYHVWQGTLAKIGYHQAPSHPCAGGKEGDILIHSCMCVFDIL